jgi:uncharacterized SAM-binding protein YcdF (DUF218 family)
MEADVMAVTLEELGVPAQAILRERMSHHTRDNARYTAALCGRRGVGSVTLVTCGWHLPRARMLFEDAGLEVASEVSAGDGVYGWGSRAWIDARELFLRAMAARARARMANAP